MLSSPLPAEFQFESEWSSPVVFHATFTPRGWLVAAAQHGVRAVLSLFDPELAPVRTRIVSKAKQCTWHSVRPLMLPDGRCLLSVTGGAGANFELDLQTLEHSAPPAWSACGGKDRVVMQLAALGDQIILGTGRLRNERLLRMPANAREVPAAFFADFELQMTAAGSLFAGSQSAFEGMTALGKRLLLAHRYFLKMKSVGHALLTVDSAGRLAQLRNMSGKLERARFTYDLQWFPDAPRKLALLYGGRVLEAVDAELASHGRVDGAPLFKTLIPLAADGGGGVLWYGARAGRVVATRAAELDPRELAGSLAQLASQYAAAPVPKRAARPARAKTSAIARPTLDLARLDTRHYRETRDDMLAIANGTFSGTPVVAWSRAASRGVQVAAFTSAIEPDHPVIAVSTRLAAQAKTGEISEKLGVDPDEVSFPVGPYTLTRRAHSSGTNAGEWNEAWMRATISRDRASLDFLEARHDPSFVTAGEDYRLAMRAAFIAVRIDPARAVQEIERARELAQPRHVRYEDRTEIAALNAPQFPMLLALAARDERAFERALLDALVAHKRFYSTPSRRLSEHGIIAWPLLALCCIARDLELRFEAVTEYLPKVLL